MSKNQILVIGAGGHSKVVTEIINSKAEWEIVAYLDENVEASTFLAKPLVKTIEEAKQFFPYVNNAFVAIGSNLDRRKWHAILKKNGYQIPWFNHNPSIVSLSANIGDGSLLTTNSVAGPSCVIGEGVIVNTGAILDHDTIIGSFAHIRQGSIICGGAQVEPDFVVSPDSVIEKTFLRNNL